MACVHSSDEVQLAQAQQHPSRVGWHRNNCRCPFASEGVPASWAASTRWCSGRASPASATRPLPISPHKDCFYCLGQLCAKVQTQADPTTPLHLPGSHFRPCPSSSPFHNHAAAAPAMSTYLGACRGSCASLGLAPHPSKPQNGNSAPAFLPADSYVHHWLRPSSPHGCRLRGPRRAAANSL